MPPASDSANTAARLAAAAPAPAGAEPARVGDRRVARLGAGAVERVAAVTPRSTRVGGSAVVGLDVGRAALLGDRRDRRVGQDPQRRRRDREHGGRQCRRPPRRSGTARVRVHDHPDRPARADRRDAADREARSARSPRARVARRMSGSPVTAARRATSTRFGPDTRQMIGSGPSSAGATNTSDLTIWPSSAPTAAAASSAVCVDSSKVTTSSVDPLALSGVEDALDGGMVGRVGHGRSLASGPADRTASIGAMESTTQADRPRRRRRRVRARRIDAPGPAGCRRRRSSSRPTAARATPRPLGLAHRPLGRRRRLARRGRLAALEAAGVPVHRVADGQGRIRHGARPASPRSTGAPTGSSIARRARRPAARPRAGERRAAGDAGAARHPTSG